MKAAVWVPLVLAAAAALALRSVLRPSGADPGPALASPLPAPSPPRADAQVARGRETPESLSALGRARRVEGASKESEEAFARIVREFPDHPLASDAADAVALAALSRGDRAAAERALARSPGGEERAERRALVLALAEDEKKRGDLPAAGARLSRLLSTLADREGAAPERDAVWERLRPVAEELLFRPDDRWRSLEVVVGAGDSYHRIAKRLAAEQGLRHGVGLLRAVNRKSGDRLRVGERLRVPLDALRIVVHRPSFSLIVFVGEIAVRLYPVGLGRDDAETPSGIFEIGVKDPHPIWWKPNPPLPYGHPENPLGSRWLGFARDGRRSEYGIHGTERDDAIGRKISNGCIRLHNADVEELYDWVPDAGTIVEVR